MLGSASTTTSRAAALPVVLHAGFTVDMHAWYEWGYVDALKPEYRLILVDPRGHGKSDKPHDPAAYEMSLRAGDVLAVLDQLAIQQAHYVGYSMGGRIGFDIAKLAPARLSSLMIGGSNPFAFEDETAVPGTASRMVWRRSSIASRAGRDQDARPFALGCSPMTSRR